MKLSAIFTFSSNNSWDNPSPHLQIWVREFVALSSGADISGWLFNLKAFVSLIQYYWSFCDSVSLTLHKPLAESILKGNFLPRHTDVQCID